MSHDPAEFARTDGLWTPTPSAVDPRSEYYIPVVVERTGRGERS